MSTGTSPVRESAEGRPVDRNGFYLSAAQVEAGVDAAGEPLVMTRLMMDTFRRRERKWQEMLKNWDQWMPKKRDKVKERCRKGIPNTMRGWSWRVLCGADKLEARSPGRFDELALEADGPQSAMMADYLEIIERDLDRTFPHNERFSQVGGEGQLELRKVLRALAMANKELGYCQGMGMIAGTLMMQMPTEQAFWCMVAMQDPALGYLHGFFDAGLGEIQICGMVLHWLMRTHLPAVHEKFGKEQMDPVLYMVDWFMCCFVKTLPWASVLRVWDMFMFEGMKIVYVRPMNIETQQTYRVALAILKLSEKELTKKKNGMGELMMYLKNLPDAILVPDVLMPAALGIKLKTKEIAQLHKVAKAEYERTHPPKKRPDHGVTQSSTAPVVTPTSSGEVIARKTSGRASGGAGAATLYESDDDDTDVDDALGAQVTASDSVGEGSPTDAVEEIRHAAGNAVTDLDNDEEDEFEEAPVANAMGTSSVQPQHALIAVADV